VAARGGHLFIGEDLRGWLLGYGLVALMGWPPGCNETSASASSPTKNATSPELAVAAAGLAGVVAIIASSVPMWNQILRYARGR
jgi:hypothetical protein